MPRGKKRPLIEEDSEGVISPDAQQEKDVVPTIASPFTIIYKPPRTSNKRSSKAARRESEAQNVTSTLVEENPLGDGNDMVYSVRPPHEWATMKRFRNFMVAEETFTLDQYVYVNHSGIPHGEELSDANAKMFWIARVLEIRATDPEHVYIRVFWLYWPNELPDGAQAHHGEHELVASNHMEILDAMTVTGRAQVQHWREDDDDEVPAELFWRQTYDCQTHQLSIIRKHCTCEGYYNPDSMLVNCSNATCKIWLHKECILKDVLSRVYKQIVGTNEGGNEDTIEVGKPNARSKGKKASNATSAAENSDADPWEGVLDAKLVRQKTGRQQRVRVAVTDLRGGSGGNPPTKARRQSQDKPWLEDIHCLRCKEKIV